MNNALATQSAPYSQEAEEATLGGLLLLERIGAEVKKILGGHEVFFFTRHGYVYQAMLRIEERGDPIDYLTLLQELKDLGWLEEIGGPAYITYLVNNTPTSVYTPVYAHLVRRAADRRRMMIALDEMKALTLNEEITIDEVRRLADEKWSNVEPELVFETLMGIEKAVDEQRRRLESLRETPQFGVPSGIGDLDAVFGGLRRARTYGVLARTHIGKTSFMLSAALNAAHLGGRIYFISLEETLQDLTDRLVSLEAGIEKDKFQTGDLTENEFIRYWEASERVARLPITLETPLSLTPRELLTSIKDVMREKGLDAVMVDYVQKMSAGPKDKDGEYEKLLYISGALPSIAKLVNLPLVYGVQAKRAVEERKDKHPLLEDAEGCGRIEQQVDVMFGLYRESKYNPLCESPNQFEVDVLKNKVSGKLGRVYAYSDPTTGRVMTGVRRRIDLLDDLEDKPRVPLTNPFAKKTSSHQRGFHMGTTHASKTATDD